MNRVNEIISDPEFKSRACAIEDRERNRFFCKHGISHSLDVARIAFILNANEALGFDKESIYAAALLHDIGRSSSDADLGHAKTSAAVASGLLRRCGYAQDEISLIVEAIGLHSGTGASPSGGGLPPFSELIFRADKLSRACFLCPAQAECDWPYERKNKELSL